MGRWLRRAGSVALLTLGLGACKEDAASKPQGTAPPTASAVVSACAIPGRVVDAVSAAFFAPTVGTYCVDPHGEEKTYGERGKLEIGAICTTALDGGCEEYKRFGVTRSVVLHYIANDGPATVEVGLWTFAHDGAFTIYTTRLTGEVDPADEHAPKPFEVAGGLGAIGTGKAYAQRGAYFLELTYNNDQQTPAELKASSDAILPVLARDITGKLPKGPDVPASARALPAADRVPNGVTYFDQDVLGLKGAGAGAVGFYTAAGKRYRMVALVRDTADQAADFLHGVRGRPGAMPVANLGDEAVEVVLQAGEARPKIDWVIARKGPTVLGVGDEEWVINGPKLSKADKVALVQKALR